MANAYSCKINPELYYDPFGMLLVGRDWMAASSAGYTFGFNGQEQDDEIYGNGNLNTAEFWEYDTRLGRRWNIDPSVKAWNSGYLTFSNNPIIFIDPKGMRITITKKDNLLENLERIME